MLDSEEIVYEQIGVNKDGTPIYGPAGTGPTYDESAIEVAPAWQGWLALIFTALMAIALYPGS
jgi:hypothetical protein